MLAENIIKILDLKSLSMEGGFYKETYRSTEKIPKEVLPKRYCISKPFCTVIYYLLTPDTCSALHRLPTDEIFHFYLGDPVIMLQLHPDETSETIVLGHKIDEDEHVQVCVPKGTWQGSFLKEGGKFALMGTTMAPGFDFSEYETGDRNFLIQKYPNQKNFIIRLSS